MKITRPKTMTIDWRKVYDFEFMGWGLRQGLTFEFTEELNTFRIENITPEDIAGLCAHYLADEKEYDPTFRRRQAPAQTDEDNED